MRGDVTHKPGRNEACPCGSGAKYKFCCIGTQRVERLVPLTGATDTSGAPVILDLTDDIMNLIPGMNRALRYFCKDNDLFLASSVLTVGQTMKFTEDLKAGVLTKGMLIEAYREGATRHAIEHWVEDACANYSSFSSRRAILMDAVTAHYQGSYSLSVPVLFAQIEGILRDIGGLAAKENVRPTIKKDWDSRTLFGLTEGAAEFNAFLSKLYEGQKGGGLLNRNRVLHGTDTTYGTLENSLILLLVLVEVRSFLWFETNTSPFV
ncbi:YecA family protein [Brevundimonas naejangsanensis]